MSQEPTRRRFSNLFNPPELYNSESSSDTSSEEVAEDAVTPMDTNTAEPSSEPAEQPARPSLRRSSRKVIRSNIVQVNEVSTRPVRLSTNNSDSAIKKYYLDKKVKKLNPSLETIYEEPQVINDEVVVMSTRKFKRMINFEAASGKNSSKVKKRKAKSKKLKHKKIMKKVSMEFFNNKLKQIDE